MCWYYSCFCCWQKKSAEKRGVMKNVEIKRSRPGKHRSKERGDQKNAEVRGRKARNTLKSKRKINTERAEVKLI